MRNRIAELAQALKPYVIKWIPEIQSVSNSNSTAVGRHGLNSSAHTGTLAVSQAPWVDAHIALHAAKDYILAHPTNDPTINRNGTYYSYNFGIVGGASTDESNNILTMLNTVGAAGGGICVIRSVNGSDPIYINKVVSIYHSNVHVEFRSPVIFGAAGSLRIMGEFDEFSRKAGNAACGLRASSYLNGSNETVLPLRTGEGANFVVGDKIVVRGQNDASGKALTKDISFVKSISSNDLTLVDELDYTFDPTYPASEWPPDLTTGTTVYVIRSSTFTGNIAAGTIVATVADASSFVVGDLLVVSDNRTEHAMNSSAITGSGVPYKNPANLEMVKIIGISGNDITFDRALVRNYETTYYGGVAKLLPIQNSSICGARISYNADQASRSTNSLQATYAENCHIYDCVVDGLGGRKGQALRLSYTYNCSAYRNLIRDAKYTGSGEGYGISLYYCTNSMVYNNVITGCRHSILLQLATIAGIYGNESRDDRISGIDCHGVRSYGIHIHDNLITRSNGVTVDSTNGAGIRVGNTSHSNGDFAVVVEDNVIIYYVSSSDQGFDVIPASSDVIFRNNTVFNAYNGFRFTRNSSQVTPVQTASNITLEGNRFVGCTNRVFDITANPTYDGSTSVGKLDRFNVLRNVSERCTKHFAIFGNGGVTNVLFEGNLILNAISSSSEYAYNINGVTGLVMRRNSARGANRGISLTSVTTAIIAENDLGGLVTGTPYNDGGSNTSITILISYTDSGVGIGTAAPGDMFEIRAGSGKGLNVNPDFSGYTFIYTYDRAASTYSPLIIDGQTISLRPNASSVDALVVDSAGTTINNALTINGDFGAWTNVSYNTGWSDYNADNSGCRYRKIGDMIFVEGFCKRDGVSTTATMFTLPVGYRPARDKHFATDTNSPSVPGGRVEITDAGTVTLIEPTFTTPGVIGYVCLDGIVFSTL